MYFNALKQFKRMIGKRIRARINFPVLAFLIIFISCGRDATKVLPLKQKITESVYSSVTVQPDSLYEVHAVVSGILERNLVEEGDRVRKGTPILQVTDSTPRLNADNAQLALRLARENYNGENALLKTLRDEIDAASLQLKNDSINYFRQKNLWLQNIGSAVAYENRKLAFELSSNKLQSLKNQYLRTKTELLTKMEQAENNLKSATITTRDFTIRSEINGTVYTLTKEAGELVTSMEPLATLGSSHRFLIEMRVDEVDIVKLRKGQRALITLDAYGDEIFEASVIKIYPRKDDRTQTFKVDAEFKDPPEILYPGLAGEGNIIVAEKNEALTIPKTYLRDGDRVQTESGMKQVTTGLQNLERVEILSGLDADTYILKPNQ